MSDEKECKENLYSNHMKYKKRKIKEQDNIIVRIEYKEGKFICSINLLDGIHCLKCFSHNVSGV